MNCPKCGYDLSKCPECGGVLERVVERERWSPSRIHTTVRLMCDCGYSRGVP